MCGSVADGHWNGCAYHVPACGQCGGCALEQVCLWWRVCTGTGVLIMCQHVGSAASVPWNVWCAYHVPACGHVYAFHVPACGQCPGTGVLIMCEHVGTGTSMLIMCQHVGSLAGVLERMCSSCASMWAVRRVCPGMWAVCAGTGVLIMRQHVGSVAGVRRCW